VRYSTRWRRAGSASSEINTLLHLTERYCVVYQTLAHPPELSIAHATAG